MKMKRSKQKGFTLIELMIVVAIIGVLSAIAVPAYKNYVTKSEVASSVATLKSIITPAELYYQENGSFPASDSDLNEVGVGNASIKSGTLSIGSDNKSIELTIDSISGAKAVISRDSNTGWSCSVTGLGSLSAAAPSSCPHS
nr:prepilin-type N-terminal cleavage/methylation domain-containing protein [Vibrio astriarenae]